ncbi:MAG: ABC transporter substrate-binding protein [Chloroflexota bacterium]|nr:ABC transporter substrate-binding protein [Chloroflexota bacterium]MDE2885310.1 ABC transporter substrate-binding protein [Chloroflexota bacterium]
MADLRLTIATFPHGQWDGLKDGRVKPEGIELEHIQASPNTYRLMVRNLEFDIAEVALTTFIAAKWFKIPITGIPIFSNRDVTMSPITYNVHSGIKTPKDLEGKRVGLRSFTVTNTTQCRALLKSEFGVDTDSIQYSVSEDAHVAQYENPPNVKQIPDGKTLEQMLVDGELDAGLQLSNEPGGDIGLLLTEEEADEVGLGFFRRTGVYPIGHVMTIKDSVLQEHPWVGPAMFRAFAASKDFYVDGLSSIAEPARRDRQALRNRELVGGDPFPMGLAKNRQAMEAMIQIDVGQHIIPEPMEVDSLFAPNTLDLE